MRIFLDPDLLKWLSNVLSLDPGSFSYTLNSLGKCEIRTESLLQDLSMGLVLGDVLKTIKQLNRGVLGQPGTKENTEKLELLKKTKSSGARAYNWNILFEQLQSLLDFKVEKDTRDLLLAEDLQVAADLLGLVYTKCKLRGLRMNVLANGPLAQPPQVKDTKKALSTNSGQPQQKRADSALGSRVDRSIQSEMKVPQNQGLFKDDLGDPQKLSLETFDPFVDYPQAQNCLSFILLAICKNIQVNAVQAASLLANGNKYLSQLLVKGKKGNYQPVISMLSDIFKNMPTLLKLVEQEESQGIVKFILQCLKGVFHSQNIEVAKYGCRIYSKLLYDLANRDFLPDAWEWFGSLYGGFFAIHTCFDRFGDDIIEPLCTVLSQIGRFSCAEMFTVEFRKILPVIPDYVKFVNHLLGPMSGSKLIKEDIQNGGVFEFLFEMGMKCDDPENLKNTPFRIQALDLLRNLWSLYPFKFESDATLGNGVLSLMKRCSRQAGTSPKICIYTYLFNLMHQFAHDRNPYAPVVYKILVFSFIENFKDRAVREHLSVNLKLTLAKLPTLPVSILVEPLTKQFGMLDDELNLTLPDIELMRAIVSHPRLTGPTAVLLFNTVSKLLLNSFCVGQTLSTILLGLLRRHLEEEDLCEYAVKFVSVALAAVYKSFREGGAVRLDNDRRLGAASRDPMTNDEIERELKAKSWRALIINTIKEMILLRQYRVNDELESRLLFTNREICKVLGYNYKGIIVLLNLLNGDVDALTRIEEYDKEMKAVEELREQNLKRNNFLEGKSPAGATTKSGRPLDERERETQMFRKELLGLDDQITVKTVTHNDGFRKTDKKKSKVTIRSNSMRGDDLKLDDDDDLEALSEDELADLKKKFGDNFGLKDRAKGDNKGGPTTDRKDSKNKAWQKDGADPKIREYLDKIKQKKEEKRLKSIETELAKKVKEDKINKHLEGELQWRKKLNPTKEEEMFLDHNLGEIYLRGAKPQAIESFIPLDPVEGSEETLEKEYMNMLLLKHKAALQYLFKRYANSIQDKNAGGTFDLLGKRAGNLSLAELNKLLTDYYISEFTDKPEVAGLVRTLNEKGGANQKTPKYLDFDGFQKFLANFAVLIHSRSPINLPDLSYSLMLQSLLEMLDKGRKLRGEEQPNFGAQTSAKYLQEKDMIDLMNFRLQQDPEFVLPPNFRKVREKKINLEYKLPAGLMVPQSYKDCYEIIEEMIMDAFEVHMIEPQGKFYWTTEAHPREDLFETDQRAVKEFKDKRRRDKLPPSDSGKNLIQLLRPDPKEAARKRIEEAQRAKDQEKFLRGPASFQVKSREEFLKAYDSPSPAQPGSNFKPLATVEEKPKSSVSPPQNRSPSQDEKGPTGPRFQSTAPKKLDIKNAGGPDDILRQSALKRAEFEKSKSLEREKAEREKAERLSKENQTPVQRNGKKSSVVPSVPDSKEASVKTATLRQISQGQLSADDNYVKQTSNVSQNTGGSRPGANRSQNKERSASPQRPPGMSLTRQQQLEADMKRMKVMADISKPKGPASPSPEDLMRMEEFQKKRQEKLKAQVKAYKEQKQQEEERRKEEQRKKAELEEKAKRERSRAAMRVRKEELKNLFEKEEDQRKQRSASAKKKAEEEKEKIEKLKVVVEAGFKNDREKMAREQQYNEKIVSLLNSAQVKSSLQQYEPQLKYIFKHYSEIIKDPSLMQTTLQNSTDILHFRNFIAFATQFNLVPTLVSIPEVKVMYRSCTKHKSLDNDNPIGLDYKAFTEMLLRMTIKKPEFFENIAEKSPISKPSGEKSQPRGKSAEQKGKGAGSENKGGDSERDKPNIDLNSEILADFSGVKNFEDSYADIGLFTPESMAGFISYLEIPQDKIALVDKLNSLRKENMKSQPVREKVKAMQAKYGLRAGSAEKKSPRAGEVSNANLASSINTNNPPRKPEGRSRDSDTSSKKKPEREVKGGKGKDDKSGDSKQKTGKSGKEDDIKRKDGSKKNSVVSKGKKSNKDDEDEDEDEIEDEAEENEPEDENEEEIEDEADEEQEEEEEEEETPKPKRQKR